MTFPEIQSVEQLLDAEIDALGEPTAARMTAPVSVAPPQIIDGLDPDKYHGDLASVSVGGLLDLQRSPLHHWWAHRRPAREPKEPTAAQRLGVAIHAAVFEPERFAAQFAVAPEGDRRYKEAKAAYAEFLENLGDRHAISSSDHATALRIAARIRDSKLGAMLLPGARTEVSVYWTDRATGVRCRMRPDAVPATRDFLLDLKSCESAEEQRFRNRGFDYGYHVRAAWYVDGWKAATGERRDYVFTAWEKEEPHASAWYYAEEEMLEVGRATYRALLSRYAECLEADTWPGYSEELQPMYLPPWAADGR